MKRTSKTRPREHDFSRGVRGKHVAALRNGHKTVILKADGSTDTYTTRPVILDRDVQSVFKDSKAVNKALRDLIESASGRVAG
jgi:hypothetical protein